MAAVEAENCGNRVLAVAVLLLVSFVGGGGGGEAQVVVAALSPLDSVMAGVGESIARAGPR